MNVHVQRLVTSGTFSLDGGTWEVDNNVWIVGDENQVVVIDPAHDAEAVAAAVAGREVTAILLTHGHDDHIRYAREASGLLGGAPIYLNPADRMLWDEVFGDESPDHDIADGQVFTIAGVELVALSTPGHSPGSTCFYADSGVVGADVDGPVLFSGDTLFQGGPGATGRSYSSFDEIIESIRGVLFGLPDETVVLTGHGDATTIGDERPHLQEWIDRGH